MSNSIPISDPLWGVITKAFPFEFIASQSIFSPGSQPSQAFWQAVTYSWNWLHISSGFLKLIIPLDPDESISVIITPAENGFSFIFQII